MAQAFTQYTPRARWHRITTTYIGVRACNFFDQADRAQLLMQIRTHEPWRDRYRYGSVAIFNDMKTKTWRAIVEDEFHDDFREVENTVAILQTFDKADMMRWGREALHRAVSRTGGGKLAQQLVALCERRHGGPVSVGALGRFLDAQGVKRTRNNVGYVTDKAHQDLVAREQRFERALMQIVAKKCSMCSKIAAKALKG